jgi:chemotaxis signal transduction protein
MNNNWSDADYLAFVLGGKKYAMEVPNIQEVGAMRESTNGTINLRGKRIPLLDLPPKLNLQVTGSMDALIIMRVHGKVVGISVEALYQVFTPGNPAKHNNRPSRYSPYINTEDEIELIVDPEKIWSKEEIGNL